MKDPYAVLGVPKDASEAQIRYAYRQALRENASGESPVELKERIDEVEAAYRTLTDPRRRRETDGAPAGVQVRSGSRRRGCPCSRSPRRSGRGTRSRG